VLGSPCFRAYVLKVDVRPVKYISVGPYYGIRNGTLALGVALRIHAVK